MKTPQQSGWFAGRTRLITIASVVAIGVAGATAIGANIGILNAASNNEVGNLSAAGDLTPSTQVVDVYLDGQGATTTLAPVTPSATAAGVQEFTVDTAGTVAVATTDTGLRLDSVAPAAGWTWTLSQTSTTELMVSFTDGTRTLEFVATVSADGNIVASVNEPIVTAAPPAANNGNGGGEVEHEGGGDDD
jgi:hypothetical protein